MKAAIPLFCKAVTLCESEPTLRALTQMAVLEATTALLRNDASEEELRALGLADELVYFAAASVAATGRIPGEAVPKAGGRAGLIRGRGARQAA